MEGYSLRRRQWQDVSVQLNVLAGGDPAVNPLIDCPANHTIYLQRILVTVTTDAAKILTFKDTAGTPVVFGATKASPGIGTIILDYGPDGVALTANKDLQLATDGAGLAGVIHVEAYAKPDAVRTV